MPKYFITDSEELAKGISGIKAIQEGCDGVTAYWWEVIAHPSSGDFALIIPNAELVLEQGQTVKTLYVNPPENPTLTITTDSLTSHANMEANGWFVTSGGI